MKILVLNCGSSSAKYQLFDMQKDEKVLAGGIIERVGLPGSTLTHKRTGCEKLTQTKESSDHTSAINHILDILTDKVHGVVSGLDEIKAVGHRVVHGGTTFKESVIVTQQVIDEIENVVELAPLHNPAHLKGIYAITELLPDVPQVTVFDTAFHQTMPDYSFMYALPYELYEKYKIRRYGFHGTSHRYVSARAAAFLGKKPEDLKLITCHLGNGASVAAVKNGKCLDTSMGLTPVEGLMMGTRTGDLDLGAIFFIMAKEGIDGKQANLLVNRKSGMLGISGISSDMRDIESAAQNQENSKARLALEMYSYRVKKYIGSYAAAMGGVDAIIFTAGIGENSSSIRKAVCEGLEYMGVEFDHNKNESPGGVIKDISGPGAKVKVLIVPTDEELLIARDTFELIRPDYHLENNIEFHNDSLRK